MKSITQNQRTGSTVRGEGKNVVTTTQLGTGWVLRLKQIPDAKQGANYETTAEAFMALNNSTGDVAVIDVPTAESALLTNKELKIIKLEDNVTFKDDEEMTNVCIANRKDDEALRDKLQSAMDKVGPDCDTMNKIMIDMSNGVFRWVWYIATQFSDLFIAGTIITLIIAVVGTILGFILGFIIGIVEDASLSKDDPLPKKIILGFIKVICKIYVGVFRDTPMIVQAKTAGETYYRQLDMFFRQTAAVQ